MAKYVFLSTVGRSHGAQGYAATANAEDNARSVARQGHQHDAVIVPARQCMVQRFLPSSPIHGHHFPRSLFHPPTQLNFTPLLRSEIHKACFTS